MKKRIIFLICGLIVVVNIIIGYQYKEETYSIAIPYYCPIGLESEEWESLQSLEEKIAVCEIPEEILKEMQTKALVESVVACPLIINMFAHNSIEFGFNQVKGYYNGLDELTKRPDARHELEGYLKRVDPNDTLTVLIVETLIKYIN